MTLVKPLTDIARRHYEWATRGSQGRIPLGFSFIDRAISGGVALGEVAMFLARSGVGKSWWACNVAVNNPAVPTLFFSLEMQDRFMLQRIAAVHTGTPTELIEREIRETGSSPTIERTIADFPLLSIVDKPEMSLKDMSAACREYEQQYGRRPELVIADYLELIKSGMALSSLEAVDNTSRQVKNWARQEDVAFVVLHQTNMNQGARSGRWEEGRRAPAMDNGHLPLTRQAARYGGDVAADYTIAAYRPALDPDMSQQVKEMREREYHLQLLKNRGGHRLYEAGIPHDVDVTTWRIRSTEQMAAAWGGAR